MTFHNYKSSIFTLLNMIVNHVIVTIELSKLLDTISCMNYETFKTISLSLSQSAHSRLF